jgi:hypothetical protein
MPKRQVLWLCCPLVFLSLTWAVGLQGKEPTEVGGQRLYTTANIWYERPDKIYSTNYHKGTILPSGTEVKDVSRAGNKIVFSEVSGLTYTLHHVKSHSTIALEELFERYFSTDDPMAEGGKFSRFTDEEKRHISSGTVSVGMSKDAVLTAYGYPPSHRTPSLAHNTWIYWRHRMARMLLHFGKDTKLKHISDAMGPW